MPTPNYPAFILALINRLIHKNLIHYLPLLILHKWRCIFLLLPGSLRQPARLCCLRIYTKILIQIMSFAAAQTSIKQVFSRKRRVDEEKQAMAYKTNLLHLDGVLPDETALDIALRVAADEQAL